MELFGNLILFIPYKQVIFDVMAFIDNLAFGLFAVSFAGFLLLYMILRIYRAYKNKQKNYSDQISSAAVPLLFLGVYLFVIGLYGQMTWPLPGSYNILFYDPTIAFGLILISFWYIDRMGLRFEYVGFLSMLVGIMLIMYGYIGYTLGLTKAPLALFGMYFLYGATGILAFPVSLLAEKLSGFKGKTWIGWTVVVVLFCLAIFAASLLAAYTGYQAIWGHLLTAP